MRIEPKSQSGAVESMGATTFEVGVLFPGRENGTAKGDAVMLLRTWDSETIQRSIAWLRAKNARARRCIYARTLSTISAWWTI